MPVDIASEVVIARPRDDVAAFVAHPENATRWLESVKAVEWMPIGPLAIGSKVTHVTSVLGGSLTYTYEVLDHEPGEHIVMSTEDGPFPLETTYEWEDAGDGTTRMRLRNRAEPKKFSKLSAKLMARAMQKVNRKDLERLKAILEDGRGA
jgi:uncharacterized membrane protein